MGGLRGILKLLGLSLLGAVFFFWSDIKRAFYAPPVSVVDATCGKLWVARAQNDPALACYLQHNISRLCEPLEREHLRWIFQRYARDKTAFGQDMLFAVTSAAFTKNIIADNIAAAVNVDMIPRSKLLAMFRNIVSQGLVDESDFGWFPDSLILDGFRTSESTKVTAKRTCG